MNNENKDTRFRLQSWKDGGLIIQKSKIIQDTKRTKPENVGTWSKWVDYKYPTVDGVGMSLVRMLWPDTDLGDVNNSEDIIKAMDRLAEVVKTVGEDVAEAVRERGIV